MALPRFFMLKNEKHNAVYISWQIRFIHFLLWRTRLRHCFGGEDLTSERKNKICTQGNQMVNFDGKFEMKEMILEHLIYS